IGLDLDPLEAIASAEGALADDAPAVHEGHPNLYLESRMEAGDVDGAFADASAVIERLFVHERVSAAPIEPRGLLVEPVGAGVKVVSSTQGPHKLRLALSEVLGLELDAIQVVCPHIGGGFGQKAHVYPEEIVVVAVALRLGRPVRWMEDRVENLLAATHARQ